MSKEYSAAMAAKLIGVSASVLKQWEKHFTELAVHQDAKGSRIYTEKEIQLLKSIYHLTKERGFTLEGAQKEMLRNETKNEKREQAIAQLQQLRGFLVDLKGKV